VLAVPIAFGILADAALPWLLVGGGLGRHPMDLAGLCLTLIGRKDRVRVGRGEALEHPAAGNFEDERHRAVVGE